MRANGINLGQIMLSQRLEQLGLQEIIKKRQSDEDYQIEMAKKLRALACDYVAGKLKNINDGPAVIALREFIAAGALYPIKTVDQFVQSQKKDGVWAEQMNFVVQELLNCNIALMTDSSIKEKLAPTIWDNDKKNAVTLTIKNNDSNTHWEAVIKGKPVRTKGDGNCYYNAVALSLKSEIEKKQQPLKLVIEKKQDIELTKIHPTPQEKRESNEKADAKVGTAVELTIQKPVQPKPIDIKQQIEEDYKYALQVAGEELTKSGQKIEVVKFQEQLLAGFFSQSKKTDKTGPIPAPAFLRRLAQ